MQEFFSYSRNSPNFPFLIYLFLRLSILSQFVNGITNQQEEYKKCLNITKL